MAIKKEAIKETAKFPMFKAFGFNVNLSIKIMTVHKITELQYKLLIEVSV